MDVRVLNQVRHQAEVKLGTSKKTLRNGGMGRGIRNRNSRQTRRAEQSGLELVYRGTSLLCAAC